MPAAGRTLRFASVVTNTVNVPLRQVAVAVRAFTGSGPAPAFTCPSAVLEAGATATSTADYTATQADLDEPAAEVAAARVPRQRATAPRTNVMPVDRVDVAAATSAVVARTISLWSSITCGDPAVPDNIRSTAA